MSNRMYQNKLRTNVDFNDEEVKYQIDYEVDWRFLSGGDQPQEYVTPPATKFRIVSVCIRQGTMRKVYVQQGEHGRLYRLSAKNMWYLNYEQLKLYCKRNNIPRTLYKDIETYRKAKFIRGVNSLQLYQVESQMTEYYKDRPEWANKEYFDWNNSGGEYTESDMERDKIKENYPSYASDAEFSNLSERIVDLQRNSQRDRCKYWSDDEHPQVFIDNMKTIIDNKKQQMADLDSSHCVAQGRRAIRHARYHNDSDDDESTDIDIGGDDEGDDDDESADDNNDEDDDDDDDNDDDDDDKGPLRVRLVPRRRYGKKRARLPDDDDKKLPAKPKKDDEDDDKGPTLRRSSRVQQSGKI